MAMYADEYSDPYEARKQKAPTRPSAAAPVPAAPTNFPPPPTPTGGYTGRGAAPAPAPASAPAPTYGGGAANKALANAGGPGKVGLPANPNQAQIDAWFNEAVNAGGYTETGANTSETAYGLSGFSAAGAPDSTGMRAYAKQNGMSEDFDRWSESQLKKWESAKDSSCPPNTPYRSYTDNTCVEKPIDSNTQQAGGGSGGAGGGGGRGGAGGSMSASSSTTTASSTAPGGDIASMMDANLKKALAGDTSRYSPQAMQGLLAQIKQRIESSKSTQLRQAESEAAGRGMSRSGRTGTNLGAIRRGAEAEFTGQYGNTLRAKIDADRQDKNDALDRAQRYLDSMRDEFYRRDMSAIQRQQFKANLDLAYANITAQRNNMRESFQQQKDMLGANYGYQATFGGV